MTRTLHDMYARSMQCHGYGHGFYEPESSDEVYPGLCGYIDESGRWQTVLDLADTTKTMEPGFTKLEIGPRMAPSKRRWDPKTSSAVIEKKTHLEAGVSALPTGIPVDASILWTYSHASDFRSIPEMGFGNAKQILKAYPDVKKSGFFVVTSTWTTSSVSTTAWNNPSNQVEVGARVGVEGIGELGPSFEYFRTESSGSWVDADPERNNVVFFGGLFFRYRHLHMGAKEISQKEWESRSSENGSKTVILGDTESEPVYLVEASEVGDVDTEHVEDGDDEC
ncbi:hypothetical protein DL98DRAFT_582971 [Cadophora sp. DSE1049]|nr:hypothetical protein DL98DRAFT_582971 [Cadophora sp. DSE1049]